ncbi:MAG: GAF domain-containing protein [Chloroflexi bacterium]|nr:GAF domain-containing protein [Chloroflexota bacterium]
MATARPDNQTAEPLRRRNALRVGVVRSLGSIALLSFLYYTYPPEVAAELDVAFFFGWVLVAGNLLGLALVAARRTTVGLVISILGLQIALSGFGLAYAGLGTAILVGVLSLTIISVANTLPQRVSRQVLLTAAIFGLVALLTDLFIGATEFRPYPPSYAAILRFAWALIAVLVGINLLHLFRQFNYFTLRTKLITSFVAVTLIALTLLGGINNFFARESLTREANEALFAAAIQTQDSLLDFVETTTATVTNEARLPVMSELLTAPAGLEATDAQRSRIIATLRALQNKDPDYLLGYTIYDLQGNHIIDSHGILGGESAAGRPYQERAVAGESYVSPLLISGKHDEPVLIFSAPIRTAFGDIVGVLAVEYRGGILQDLIARSNNLVGPDSFAVLFDEYTIHLAHGAAPETILTTVIPLDDATLARMQAEGRLPNLPANLIFHDLADLGSNLDATRNNMNQAYFFTTVDIATGDRVLQAAAISIEDPDWTLAIFQPQDTFLAPVEEQGRTTLLLALVVAAAVVAIAIGLAQVLTAPIASLTRTAQHVSQGDLNVQAEVGTDDEIGELARTFNAMTARLRELVTGLEAQVADRTRDLQHRAEMLQDAAEIARDATQETQLLDLLNRSVELIAQKFELYHVGIYRTNPRDQTALLLAGSDEAGQQLVESEHRVRIGSETNVGYVTLIGEARLAREGDPGIRIARHPLLPDTRAQLVVPLRVGEHILGAIDMQADRPDAFRDADIPTFRSLADQIAIAIQKNELRFEVEQTLNELESAYGRYTRESWRAFIQALENTGFRYRQLTVEPTNSESEQVRLAWERGETVMQHGRDIGDDARSTLAVPMKVRGEVVGVLNLQLEDASVPDETIALIEEISNRLSLVLENARLVEVAQRRVQRERLTADIGSRMRQYLDVESVMKVAIEEIGQRLEVPEVELRLLGKETSAAPPANGRGQNGDGKVNQ